MKKLLSLLALCLITTTVSAQNKGSIEKAKADYKNVCTRIANHAAAIMRMRQDNVPISIAIDTAEKMSGGPAYEPLVIVAYKEMYTYKVQPITDDIIANFSNKIGLACFASLSK